VIPIIPVITQPICGVMGKRCVTERGSTSFSCEEIEIGDACCVTTQELKKPKCVDKMNVGWYRYLLLGDDATAVLSPYANGCEIL